MANQLKTEKADEVTLASLLKHLGGVVSRNLARETRWQTLQAGNPTKDYKEPKRETISIQVVHKGDSQGALYWNDSHATTFNAKSNIDHAVEIELRDRLNAYRWKKGNKKNAVTHRMIQNAVRHKR